MTTKKMMQRGKLVRVLDAGVYRKIEGKISKNLPLHVSMEIERKRKEGKIEVWSMFPELVDKAIKKALGEG